MSAEDKYDLILVGSGFASAFFLQRYLAHAKPQARVLLLERGPMRSHSTQLDDLTKGNSTTADFAATCDNLTPNKQWNFSLGFGGGSNCWWACTPRMLPEDFEMQSKYGVSIDWPVSYNELEEYYCDAEETMAVSGPDNSALFPRSRPYPQPPHLFNDVDRILKKSHPDRFFVQPTARPTVDTDNRPACCASGVCGLCPIDSKFSVLNEMMPVVEDKRVTLKVGATVQTVEKQGSRATGVTFQIAGRLEFAAGDFIALGANAIFNSHLLLRSGIAHPLLGKRLNEQVSIGVWLALQGVDNFQGSTVITGHGYMLYPGAHRSERAAALMESWNSPMLRDVRGRWRQMAYMKFIFENIPSEEDFVAVDPKSPTRPQVSYGRVSSYSERGLKALEQDLPRIFKTLPIESMQHQMNLSESHVQGTALMGNNAKSSVVDRHLVHHTIRNLAVLGSSAFPTCPPANPTLTICALSLWSAEHLFGG
jgi:choline dehydrogenase-like flavoprotein